MRNLVENVFTGIGSLNIKPFLRLKFQKLILRMKQSSENWVISSFYLHRVNEVSIQPVISINFEEFLKFFVLQIIVEGHAPIVIVKQKRGI